MKKLSEHSVGLVVGAFAGLIHLVWVIVVYLGFGQTWLDFVLGLHFIENPFTVTTFEPQKAVLLVVLAAVVGYIDGWVFAKVWNWLAKK